MYFYSTIELIEPQMTYKQQTLFALLSKSAFLFWRSFLPIYRWTKTGQTSDASLALSMVETKLPLMLQCLNHEDNDVSGSVTDFSHQYVMLLKQLAPLNEPQKAFVKVIEVQYILHYTALLYHSLLSYWKILYPVFVSWLQLWPLQVTSLW